MSRNMVVALVFAVTGFGVAPNAFAQVPSLTPLADAISVTPPVHFSDTDQSASQVVRGVRGQPWSNQLLVGLEITTAATQMLDAHSTLKALNAGATEANPLMGGLAKHKAAFIGVKAAIGTGLILATHRAARNNKAAAILMAVASNSAYLMIAQHNYKVARSLQR